MLGECPICLKSIDLGGAQFLCQIFSKLAILGRYDNLTSMLCIELENSEQVWSLQVVKIQLLTEIPREVKG